MKKRLRILCVVLLMLLGCCLWRVVTIQQQPALSDAAGEQATITVEAGTARGTIYDCHLRPFLNTETVYVASVAPTKKAERCIKKSFDEATAKRLLERLKNNRPIAVRTEESMVLGEGVTERLLPVRYGGEKVLAPHVIGYIDESGGVTGIEFACNELLEFYSGGVSVTYEADATGTPVEGNAPLVSDTTALCKGGVVLTIDKTLQAIAEEAAEQMTRGAVVIMNPKTGEIQAMASVPTYQPDHVDEALNAENAPLLNRALTDYNCGSVFKIITAAAALEAGVSPDTEFTCNGGYSLGSHFFRCHYILGHGMVDMKEAFAKSCNPYFIQLALSVGAEKVYDMAVSFGMDRAWTLAEGLSTARGVLPSLQTLSSSDAELCNLAFGQGELLSTPIHVAQLASAIANNGVIYRPTLIAGTVDENGVVTKAEPSPPQYVFSEKTAAMLKPMMEYTMVEGTGAKGQPFPYPAAAKTGTAETGWVEDGQEVVEHWFTGYYPAENPQYVVTVLCENSEASGESAAPVFKEICENLYLQMRKNGS